MFPRLCGGGRSGYVGRRSVSSRIGRRNTSPPYICCSARETGVPLAESAMVRAGRSHAQTRSRQGLDDHNNNPDPVRWCITFSAPIACYSPLPAGAQKSGRAAGRPFPSTATNASYGGGVAWTHAALFFETGLMRHLPGLCQGRYASVRNARDLPGFRPRCAALERPLRTIRHLAQDACREVRRELLPLFSGLFRSWGAIKAGQPS